MAKRRLLRRGVALRALGSSTGSRLSSSGGVGGTSGIVAISRVVSPELLGGGVGAFPFPARFTVEPDLSLPRDCGKCQKTA